jgi:hypothetical protein
MFSYLSTIDLVVGPFFLCLIFVFEWHKYMKKKEQYPHYRFYLPGLFVKLFGGIGVCIVYVLWYSTGDTTNYFFDHTCMVNLFFKDPSACLDITFRDISAEHWFTFDFSTGWPIYAYDRTAFFFDRLVWVLCLFSFKSFIGETILIAWISFYAVWRLYQTLLEEFPALEVEFAFAMLFVPSVFFWGSGLLKDTVTFAAVCLFTSSFYGVLVKRRQMVKNILFILVSSWLLLSIKPYILFALLPGSLIWIAGMVLGKIRSSFIRSTISPLFAIISIGSGYFVLQSMSDYLGDYALNNVLTKAAVTQQDLKREDYKGSSFDIGEFEPTVTGILMKAHLAINATLFRPYIWEARNPVVALSGLENLGMMLFTIYLVLRLKVYNLFRLMFRHHLLTFTVCFSLFFAFSVGLTTSNFGSLVRYKIPAIPFYVASLFMIRHTYVDLRRKDNERFLVQNDQLAVSG